ncbi:MAG TPA: DUF4236 domain-containing protein, partial [Chloroflexota bacterium]|nr:DUF4236 domain-containing protein [Chloroflexota bacterium]
RRSVRILPGVRVNLNKKSTSLTVGNRFVHHTIGSRGTRDTVSLPGTGISVTNYQPHKSTHHPAALPAPGPQTARARPTGHSCVFWIGAGVLVLTLLVVLGGLIH